jgi:lysozyme family protein
MGLRSAAMAEFLPIYEDMIRDEGGYKLHRVEGDRGGDTYAGIARAMNPQWQGWAYIDRGEVPPTQMVREFYMAGWWAPIRGNQITDQGVASTIFNFAVNTSAYGNPMLAVKLAQIAARVEPDGHFGPVTLEAINEIDGELYELRFFLAKMTRYAELANKDKAAINWGKSSAKKFLLGWLNRALKEAGR